MAFKGWVLGIVFGVAALCGAGEASAQQNERREALAREIVALLEVENTVGDLFQSMSPLLADGMANELQLSQTEEARLSELLAEELRNAMPELMTAVSAMYATNLSEQELTDIVGFLRSPSGRAMMQSQKNAETELQRMGQVLGMRVALQALLRLNAERGAR